MFLSSRGWRFVPETEANRASTRDILSSSNIYEKKNIRNKLIISRIIANLSRLKVKEKERRNWEGGRKVTDGKKKTRVTIS